MLTIVEVIDISSSDEEEEMYMSSSDEDEEMDISSSDEEMDIPPKAPTSKPCIRGMRMKGKASTSKAKGGRESLPLLRLALLKGQIRVPVSRGRLGL